MNKNKGSFFDFKLTLLWGEKRTYKYGIVVVGPTIFVFNIITT